MTSNLEERPSNRDGDEKGTRSRSQKRTRPIIRWGTFQNKKQLKEDNSQEEADFFQKSAAELLAVIFKRSSTGRWDGVRRRSFHQLKFTQVVSTFRKQTRLEEGSKSLCCAGSPPKTPFGCPALPTKFRKRLSRSRSWTQNTTLANKTFRIV